MVVLIRIFIFQVELNSVSSMDIHTEFFELSRAKHSRSQGLIWALRLSGFLFKRYKAINMKKLEQSMQCIHKFYNLTCSDNCFEYLSKWFSCISFALIWTLSLGAKLTYWRLKTLGHVTAKQEQVKATQHLWNLSLYFWLCHDVRYNWKKKQQQCLILIYKQCSNYLNNIISALFTFASALFTFADARLPCERLQSIILTQDMVTNSETVTKEVQNFLLFDRVMYWRYLAWDWFFGAPAHNF